MNTEDQKPFTEMLSAIYEIRGKKISPAAIRLWWAVLERYPLQDVSAALSQLSATEKFLPTPAHVVNILEPVEWPSAGEAWALVLKDERETGAVCDELLGAWSSASELWDSGDTIGARRAFEGAWTRLAEQAIAQGKRKPQWRLSVGWDAQSREFGARKALDKGLLTALQVSEYVETESSTALLGHDDQREGNIRSIGAILGRAAGD